MGGVRLRGGVMTDDDHIVLEIPRGESDVLRITRRRYEGRTYTDVRVHFRGQDGEWHPTRKGCSVRDSEIADVAAALAKIADRVFAGGGGTSRRRSLSSQGRLPPEPERPPATDDEIAELEDIF